MRSTLFATLVVLSCVLSSPDSRAQVAPAKPNIIMIMTDDQSVSDVLAMPATLKLIANEGVTFSKSFASWPLCCPSRATALTGQYAHNHRVLGNYPPFGSAQAFADDETLPVWLQRAGYATAHIGKYLNRYGSDNRGSTYVPPGWTDWMGFVDPTTYRMWGYTVSHNGVLKTYGDYRVEDPALYQTDVVKQLALDVIDKNAATNTPFYLGVAFLAPHEEVQEVPPADQSYPGPRPAPRHANLFPNLTLPRPASFDEADLSDKPAFVRSVSELFIKETLAQRTGRYRRRLQSLRAVDEAVQAIVAKLAALNLLDNTYLVFTSDNGWLNGEHHVGLGKYLMYEPSARVPLLIRGPGIPRGGRTDELVANIDLAPTFADMAGAVPGRVVDGRSLLPYARDVSLRSGRPILLDAPYQQKPLSNSPVIIPAARGLRTRLYTYIEHETGEVELYDMQNDPDQLKSLHALSGYRNLRASFHAMLSQYAGCAGDTCRAAMR